MLIKWDLRRIFYLHWKSSKVRKVRSSCKCFHPTKSIQTLLSNRLRAKSWQLVSILLKILQFQSRSTDLIWFISICMIRGLKNSGSKVNLHFIKRFSLSLARKVVEGISVRGKKAEVKVIESRGRKDVRTRRIPFTIVLRNKKAKKWRRAALLSNLCIFNSQLCCRNPSKLLKTLQLKNWVELWKLIAFRQVNQRASHD